ncbi:hypothetical protein IJI72_01685 [Candidatus Saccharibacteria bacterium]|nr:hypothetical protein [Candidatus Saccharibacteria bacterium]
MKPQKPIKRFVHRTGGFERADSFNQARARAIEASAQARAERKAEKARLADLAAEKNRIYSQPEPESFIDPNRPGFTETEIAADRAVFQYTKDHFENPEPPEKSIKLESAIASELRSFFPAEYVTRIYPTSDIDDVLNGADLICELEKRDGSAAPLRFAIDATYKNEKDKLTQKLDRRSSAGKTPEMLASTPSTSEFGRFVQVPVDNEHPEGERKTVIRKLNPFETREELALPGVANLKFFRDSKGNPSRLSIPKFVLALPESGFFQKDGTTIDHSLNRESLLYQLANESEDIWRSLYVAMTEDTGRPKDGAINRALAPVVHDAEQLMNLFADMDARAAADPSRAKTRDVARRDTLTFGGRETLASSLVSLSHEVFAVPAVASSHVETPAFLNSKQVPSK